MSFWRELRRRNIFKVGAAYAIVGWLLMQVASVAFVALKLPAWTVTFVTAIVVIGLPIALLLAWAYEVTPEGIKRTKDIPLAQSVSELKGQRLNYLVTGLLVIAVGFMAIHDYLPGLLGHTARTAAAMPGASSISFRIQAPDASRFTLEPASPYPAASPDGRSLAFVAPVEGARRSGSTLWVQRLGELHARPLDGTAGAAMAFWSPDGRFLGYIAYGRLERIAVTGDGVPQELAANASAFGGTWSRDGTIVYTATDGLYSVPAQGGKPRRVTSIDEAHGESSSSHRYPVMLPDGRRFLYLALNRQTEAQGLYVGSLDDPELKQRVVRTDTNGALGVGPDGREHLFFVRDKAIIAQPFDVAKAELTGQPTLMAQPIEPAQSMRFAPFAAGGRSFVYRPRFDARARLVWVDRHGVPGEALSSDTSGNGFIAMSPDGAKVAAARIDPRTNVSQVWWFDLNRHIEERLTSSSDGGYFPVWTPDSAHVIYASPRAAIWNLYSRSIADTAREESVLIGPRPVAKYPRDVTRDGQYLVFQGNAPTPDVWLLPLTEGAKPRPLVATQATETTARISPNGKWLAYTSNSSGENEIYVTTFPDGNGRQRVSTGGGLDPQWRADGRELYYLTPDDVLMAVDVADTDAFEPSTPQPLFRFTPNPIASQFGSNYAPAPDGQRFLISELVGPAQPQLIVTLNWTAQ